MGFPTMAHGHRCSLPLLLLFLNISIPLYYMCFECTCIRKMIISIIIVRTTIFTQDSKHLMCALFSSIFNAVYWFLTYYQLLAEIAF